MQQDLIQTYSSLKKVRIDIIKQTQTQLRYMEKQYTKKLNQIDEKATNEPMDIIQILHGVLMGGIRNNKAARLSDKERGNQKQIQKQRDANASEKSAKSITSLKQMKKNKSGLISPQTISSATSLQFPYESTHFLSPNKPPLSSHMKAQKDRTQPKSPQFSKNNQKLGLLSNSKIKELNVIKSQETIKKYGEEEENKELKKSKSRRKVFSKGN